jgi:hypothetical protein
MTLNDHVPRPDTRLDLELSAPEVHPIAATVFEALERGAIRWSLLRGEHRLESPPHDVDLLIAADDLDKASDILAHLGFARFPTWARGTHQFFIAYNKDEDQWLRFDVVTELAYGPHYSVRTDAAPSCLARTVLVGGLRVLCADDAFWTLLLHCVLDRGEVPAHQQERLATLAAAARLDGPLPGVVTAAAPNGCSAPAAVELVRAREWQRLLTMRRPLIRRWARLHPRETLGRIARGALQWRIEPLHRALRLPGFDVLVTGADAQRVSAVAESLGRAFFLPVHVLGQTDIAQSRPLHLGVRADLAGAFRRARGKIAVAYSGSIAPPTDRTSFSLVVVLGDCTLATAPPMRSGGGRAQRVVVDAADPERARRAVIDEMWRCYCGLRRWEVHEVPR